MKKFFRKALAYLRNTPARFFSPDYRIERLEEIVAELLQEQADMAKAMTHAVNCKCKLCHRLGV